MRIEDARRRGAADHEIKRDRLIALIKGLAHPYSGAEIVVWETEALALVDVLIRPRRGFWSWVTHDRR